ncbi:MAG: 3-hydroxyacyl-CoA dehydrogenase family protein [Polyangiaceae bacterium]
MSLLDNGIEITRVGVIGSGTMGNGIAQVFAQAGHPVVLVDVSREQLNRAEGAIALSLSRLEKKGKISADQAKAARARIEYRPDVESCADCRLAIEAITEQLEPKLALFRALDKVLPGEAVLATNTSSISITRLAAATGRAPRVIGMHFMNPPPVMQLVEVIRGEDTSDATCEQVTTLCRELGKTPVEARDAPGFVSNRVLMPMINEAIFCLHEGVASREGIDEIMKLGMAHPLGPLALADLIGLDVCLSILEVLHRDLGEDKYRPCPLLRRMVAAGHLGRKSGRGFFSYAGEKG